MTQKRWDKNYPLGFDFGRGLWKEMCDSNLKKKTDVAQSQVSISATKTPLETFLEASTCTPYVSRNFWVYVLESIHQQQPGNEYCRNESLSNTDHCAVVLEVLTSFRCLLERSTVRHKSRPYDTVPKNNN